jgi:hypothetical protein
MQSINSSSLISSSEDGEAKARAEAEKLAKKNKGLSKSELESFIDIELCETNTTTLLSIPAIIGVAETEAYSIIDEEVKAYDQLLQNKKGSDSYEARGS